MSYKRFGARGWIPTSDVSYVSGILVRAFELNASKLRPQSRYSLKPDVFGHSTTLAYYKYNEVEYKSFGRMQGRLAHYALTPLRHRFLLWFRLMAIPSKSPATI